MSARSVIVVIFNVFAIIICGGLGGVAGFGLIRMLDLDGVAGALLAALVGMIVATMAWAAGVTLMRALGIMR